MSRFWINMNLLRKTVAGKEKKKEKNSLFLSNEAPDIVDKKDLIVKNNLENNLSKLAEFYNYYYMISKTNFRIKISEEELSKYWNNLRTEIVCLYDKDSLIGSIISFAIPIQIISPLSLCNKDINETSFAKETKCKETDHFMACTSYLILHNKHRGKGLGILMIQESLKVLHSLGGKAAYFINRVTRGDNSISLPVWYYPINIQKLRNCGYPYPKLYTFSLSSSPDITVSECSPYTDISKLAFDYYTDYIKDKSFAFSPSYEYFNKWLSTFQSFLIFSKLENILGFFSIMVRPCYYPNHKETINQGYVIMNVGTSNIKEIVSICREKKICDIINFYEIGDIKFNDLKEAFCQGAGNLYVNFYNLNLHVDTNNFYAPIL